MALRVVDLGDLGDGAAEVYGGKAAGLARLMAWGARVPEGFAVEARLEPPAEWPEGDRAELVRRVGELLRLGPVAVRSSAVGEDAAERSYAGMLESVVGVKNVDEALAATARCIDSGASARVLAYGGARLAVGVVFQRVVDGGSAGVCFSRDPTGTDTAVVVEAVRGAGAELVSGRAAPERWRVYRSGLGGWEARVEKTAGVLSEEAAIELAEGAVQLAGRARIELDLEWAIDGDDRLWWLQARPVTAAAEVRHLVVDRSAEGTDDGPVTVWSNWNVGETLPEPMAPLSWTVWRDEILPVVTRHVFGVAGTSPLLPHLFGLDLVHGRVYFNMNAMLAAPLLGRVTLRLISMMDARSAQTLRQLLSAGVLRPRSLPGRGLTLTLRTAVASVRGALRMRMAVRPRRALGILAGDAARIARRKDVRELDNRQLLDEVGLFSRPECRRLLFGLQMEAAAMAVYALARRAFASHTEARELLAAGIPANPTTQISLEIDRLTEAAGPRAAEFAKVSSVSQLLQSLEGSDEGRSWLVLLTGFLERFGHRGPMEFDLGAARWSEDPTMIIELVRSGLTIPPEERVSARMARLAARRKAAVDSAVAGARWWRRPMLRMLARLVCLYMPLREAPKHYGVVVFQRIRLALLELGRRLVAQSVLARADDVFLLEWPELQALARGSDPECDLDQRLQLRRERLARFRQERPPDLVRSDGVPVEEEPLEEDHESLRCLHGTPVSGGSATGPVRILAEPDPRALAPGEILVVVYADPGWTPLFPRAAAVVMEVGGLMCHAAVVAREMGTPAVFGVRRATRRLSTGCLVTVNGTTGEIVVL